MKPRPVLALPLALTLAHPASAAVIMDGYFMDWSAAALVATDPAGDAGSSGIDFTVLYVADTDQWLFLRFDTTIEVQGDEGHRITLALDTDGDPATGLPVGILGAELVWDLGQRSGTFYGTSDPVPVTHAELGLMLAPTVSDTQFELALRRDSVIDGQPLFPQPGFVASIYDGAGGDDITLYEPYRFSGDPGASLPGTVSRLSPDHIRIASYNIEQDGLFSGGNREAALDRIFDVIDPDVWVVNEVWDHTASQVAAKVEQFLPSPPGRSWSAIKLDEGNVVVSRFSVVDSWLVFPGNRLTAVLIEPGPPLSGRLLVVANHWTCCANDSRRQEQADALIAFLDDARTPGGVIDLAPETPMVAAGDFNLVGFRRQLTTLLTGDIFDNATWGPDSPPDWDGSPFEDANPLHLEEPLAYTWRRDTSSFYPGKLDWIVYTGSVLLLENQFVLDTRLLTPTSLGQYGLIASDSETASDHVPLVADLSLLSQTGVGDLEARPTSLLAAVPNPFTAGTRIGFHLAQATPVKLTIFDVSGHRVRTLAGGEPFPPGQHALRWDGRADDGRRVGSGSYLVLLDTGTEARSARVTFLR